MMGLQQGQQGMPFGMADQTEAQWEGTFIYYNIKYEFVFFDFGFPNGT